MEKLADHRGGHGRTAGIIPEFQAYPSLDNCSIIVRDWAGSHRIKSRTGVWRRWRQTAF